MPRSRSSSSPTTPSGPAGASATKRDADRKVAVESVQDSLTRRDALDSSRVVSPLRPADDAVVIDTTDRTVADITAEIADRYRAAG